MVHRNYPKNSSDKKLNEKRGDFLFEKNNLRSLLAVFSKMYINLWIFKYDINDKEYNSKNQNFDFFFLGGEGVSMLGESPYKIRYNIIFMHKPKKS